MSGWRIALLAGAVGFGAYGMFPPTDARWLSFGVMLFLAFLATSGRGRV